MPPLTSLTAFILAVQGPGQAPPDGPPPFQRQALPTAGSKPAEVTTPNYEVATAITHHTANLPSGPLTYTATAAQIPLRSETGEVECRMFYVAYTKDGADPTKRPVTFAFNGGPGSATIWLHMGALGPKRAPLNDDGTLPAPPYGAVDKPRQLARLLRCSGRGRA